jgi:L-histidine N-alpha-methyltransferase
MSTSAMSTSAMSTSAMSTSAMSTTASPTNARYTFTDLLPADFAARALRDDVLSGLTGPVKRTSPTWLYDKLGSELFEEITRLPEYYPTRAERQILLGHAAHAVALSGCRTLIELGSGSSSKTGLLLDAVARRPGADAERPRYVALDVSEDALREACTRIANDFPTIDVHGIRADFTSQVEAVGGAVPASAGPRMVAFLGSTIGNFEPAARSEFFTTLRARLVSGDHLLLGADLVKSPDILVPAYDDAAGVTAAFDLNLLDVLNCALDGDFARDNFRHRAIWDAEHEWIEMRLQSLAAHTVTLRALGLRIPFAVGEEIRTEISAKFRQETLTAQLRDAGFAQTCWWTDPRRWFSLSLWAAA